AIVNKYFNNINSQANSNIIGILDDRLDRVTYVQQDGKYVRQRPVRDQNGIKTNLDEQAPLWNPNAFKVKDYKIQPKELKTLTPKTSKSNLALDPNNRQASADDSIYSSSDYFSSDDIYKALVGQMQETKREHTEKELKDIYGGSDKNTVLVETPSGEILFKLPGEVKPADNVLSGFAAAPVMPDSKNDTQHSILPSADAVKEVSSGLAVQSLLKQTSKTAVDPEVKTDTDIEALQQEYAESNYPSWLKKIATNVNLGLLVNYSKDERVAMKIKGEEPKLPWNNEWFSPGSISGYLIGRSDNKEEYISFPITKGMSGEDFVKKFNPSLMKTIIAGLNLGLVFNYSDNEILARQLQGKNTYFFMRHWRAPGTITGALFGEKGEGYINGAKDWFNREAPKKQPDFYVPPSPVTPPVEKAPPAEKPKVEQPSQVQGLLKKQKPEPEMVGPPIPPDYYKKQQEKIESLSAEKAIKTGKTLVSYFGGSDGEIEKKLGKCPYSKGWVKTLTDGIPGKGFWGAVEKFQIEQGITKPAKKIGLRTTAAINKYEKEKTAAAANRDTSSLPQPSLGSMADIRKLEYDSDTKKLQEQLYSYGAYKNKIAEALQLTGDAVKGMEVRDVQDSAGGKIVQYTRNGDLFTARFNKDGKFENMKFLGKYSSYLAQKAVESGTKKAIETGKTRKLSNWDRAEKYSHAAGAVVNELGKAFGAGFAVLNPRNWWGMATKGEVRHAEMFNHHSARAIENWKAVKEGWAGTTLVEDSEVQSGMHELIGKKVEQAVSNLDAGAPAVIKGSTVSNIGVTDKIMVIEYKQPGQKNSGLVTIDKNTGKIIGNADFSAGVDWYRQKDKGVDQILVGGENPKGFGYNKTISVDPNTGKISPLEDGSYIPLIDQHQRNLSPKPVSSMPNTILQQQIQMQKTAEFKPYNYMSMMLGERESSKK
ncbi:MAG: hypothetical protein ABIH18_10205, partial [Candidatus Omnitrophota bacterium]